MSGHVCAAFPVAQASAAKPNRHDLCASKGPKLVEHLRAPPDKDGNSRWTDGVQVPGTVAIFLSTAGVSFSIALIFPSCVLQVDDSR